MRIESFTVLTRNEDRAYSIPQEYIIRPSMSENSNRRDFFRNSGSAAAALGFSIVKPQSARGAQANSALSVGLIGCGRRGTHVTGLFAKNEFARIAYLCDIYD